MDDDILDFTCDWDGCPTHLIEGAKGEEFITVIAQDTLKFFYSTDCLALWAGSFPIGYLVTGRNAEDV